MDHPALTRGLRVLLLSALLFASGFAWAVAQCTIYFISYTDPVTLATAELTGSSPGGVCSTFVSTQVTRIVTEQGSGASYYKVEAVGTVESATATACFYTRVTTTTAGTQPPSVSTTTGNYKGISQRQGDCPPSCPSAGTTQGKWGDAWTSGNAEPAGGLTICVGGCLATGAASGSSGGGPWEIWGPLTHTGVACGPGAGGTPPPGPPAVPDPTPPPPGFCRGDYNGNTITVPCSDGTSDGPKVNDSSGKSDGSGSDTNSTSNTTCKDGMCTTTTHTETTTTGAGGSGGGTGTGDSTKTQSQDAFCASNPKDPLCKGTEDGSFGGACSGGFTCDGDAVQCSIAKEQHIRNCQFFGEAPSTDPAVVAAAAGIHPPDHPYTTATQSSVSFASGIDQTELLSGGCPANQSFSALGRIFVVPFGELCSPLGWLGNALVALAFLACAFIVFGKREG